MTKAMKVFDVGGEKVRFDTETFKRLFRESAKQGHVKLSAQEEKLADAVYVTPAAVHAWRMGSNGPSDLEKVRSIAAFFNVDLGTLVTMAEEVSMNEKYSDRQLEAIRRIYAAIMLFLDEFERSDGFNNYWFDVVQKEGIKPENAEDRLYEIAEAKQHKVELAAKLERFDLRGLSIYDELLDFIYDDLTETYNEKLSYAYRFEAPASRWPGSDPSTWEPLTSEDYEKAIKRLDEILDKHL